MKNTKESTSAIQPFSSTHTERWNFDGTLDHQTNLDGTLEISKFTEDVYTDDSPLKSMNLSTISNCSKNFYEHKLFIQPSSIVRHVTSGVGDYQSSHLVHVAISNATAIIHRLAANSLSSYLPTTEVVRIPNDLIMVVSTGLLADGRAACILIVLDTPPKGADSERKAAVAVSLTAFPHYMLKETPTSKCVAESTLKDAVTKTIRSAGIIESTNSDRCREAFETLGSFCSIHALSPTSGYQDAPSRPSTIVVVSENISFASGLDLEYSKALIKSTASLCVDATRSTSCMSCESSPPASYLKSSAITCAPTPLPSPVDPCEFAAVQTAHTIHPEILISHLNPPSYFLELQQLTHLVLAIHSAHPDAASASKRLLNIPLSSSCSMNDNHAVSCSNLAFYSANEAAIQPGTTFVNRTTPQSLNEGLTVSGTREEVRSMITPVICDTARSRPNLLYPSPSFSAPVILMHHHADCSKLRFVKKRLTSSAYIHSCSLFKVIRRLSRKCNPNRNSNACTQTDIKHLYPNFGSSHNTVQSVLVREISQSSSMKKPGCSNDTSCPCYTSSFSNVIPASSSYSLQSHIATPIRCSHSVSDHYSPENIFAVTNNFSANGKSAALSILNTNLLNITTPHNYLSKNANKLSHKTKQIAQAKDKILQIDACSQTDHLSNHYSHRVSQIREPFSYGQIFCSCSSRPQQTLFPPAYSLETNCDALSNSHVSLSRVLVVGVKNAKKRIYIRENKKRSSRAPRITFTETNRLCNSLVLPPQYHSTNQTLVKNAHFHRCSTAMMQSALKDFILKTTTTTTTTKPDDKGTIDFNNCIVQFASPPPAVLSRSALNIINSAPPPMGPMKALPPPLLSPFQPSRSPVYRFLSPNASLNTPASSLLLGSLTPPLT